MGKVYRPENVYCKSFGFARHKLFLPLLKLIPMSDEGLRQRIHELLQGLPDKFTILEGNIPIDIQLEYFEFTKKIKEGLDTNSVMPEASDLLKSDVTVPDKKTLLCKMASVPLVEAYRGIESYSKNPDPGLEQWSRLALLESRMFLESYLTDESRVLISTGLGGRDEKLRCFFVGFSGMNAPLTEGQQTIIRVELESAFEKRQAELEELTMHTFYFTAQCLIPIGVEIREFLKGIIRECNVYGQFLRDNFIVTNVKLLQEKEIMSFLNLMNKHDSCED